MMCSTHLAANTVAMHCYNPVANLKNKALIKVTPLINVSRTGTRRYNFADIVSGTMACG